MARGPLAQSRISDLRIAGLSYSQIAKSTGVTPTTIKSWESGKTSPRNQYKAANLGRLWTRTRKTTGLSIGPSGRVNLTRYFRQVWIREEVPQLPLDLKEPPRYRFPNESRVNITARFSIWIIRGPAGEERIEDKFFSATVRPGSNGVSEITFKLLQVIEQHKNYPVKFAKMETVVLRRDN